MIELEKVLELIQPFISAASGLVELNGKFFVISDDENFVGIYNLDSKQGSASVIFNAILPVEKSARKKMKGDLEALVLLPGRNQLLLIPSGSTPQREWGALMSDCGQIEKKVTFHSLYSKLRDSFSELNIEGGVVFDDELYLFQRGNGPKKQNGIITFSLNEFLNNEKLQLNILPVDLGSIHGVNFSFTDATRIRDHILFLAVAEDSDSTYFDGKVTGSVLGMMNKKGEVLCMTPLNTSSKPEGICFSSTQNCFYLVTDDDDRNCPSSMLKGFLPSDWNIHFNKV
jgi:hypothetical protein